MATPIGTRKMKLKVVATDYTAEVSKVRIIAEDSDSDFVSFADALAGGLRAYKLKMTIKQDTAAASLWYYIWSQLGAEVAVELWPNGGTVAAALTPKITGTVVVIEPDGDLLGGDANKSTTALNSVDVEWLFIAKPVLAIV